MSTLSESESEPNFDVKCGSLEIFNSEQTFVWIINEFSKLSSEKFIRSPVFPYGINNEWHASVYLYPNGNNEKVNKNNYVDVDLFIEKNHNSNALKVDNNKIIVDCTYYLIDKDGHEYHIGKAIQAFDDEEGWGESLFIKKSILKDVNKGYLIDDKLTIYVNFRLVNHLSNLHDEIAEKNIKLLRNFEQLFEDNLFCDVTLVVSKQNFSAHRNVLASRSPVFLAMFTHDMKEKRDSKVEIDDVKPDVVKEMLRFIYCGKVQNLNVPTIELLAAAEKYQLDDLKYVCIGEMIKNLSVDNVFDTLCAFDLYNLEMKDYIIDFIKKNLKEVLDTPGYDTLCTSGNSRLIGEVLKNIASTLDEKNENIEE